MFCLRPSLPEVVCGKFERLLQCGLFKHDQKPFILVGSAWAAVSSKTTLASSSMLEETPLTILQILLLQEAVLHHAVLAHLPRAPVNVHKHAQNDQSEQRADDDARDATGRQAGRDSEVVAGCVCGGGRGNRLQRRRWRDHSGRGRGYRG